MQLTLIFIIRTLERNLDSRIYTASNIEALSYSVTKPKEIAIEYQSAPRYEDTQLTQEIRTKLGTIPRFKRCFVVTSEALQHLGPWCCDRMWKSLLFDLDRKMAVETGDLEKDALADEDLALKEAHEICDPIDFERNPDITDITKFTPKVRCLIKSLQIIIQNTTDFCGIIFVERRHTAIALKALMDKLDVFDVINSSILIGHGSTVEGDVQMQFKEQNETIEDFRIGNINLLIATNVAEEGLDIQPCNFVFRYDISVYKITLPYTDVFISFRFDFFHTLIAYIQSRGRARKPGSKYILLMEGSNGTQSGMLREFRDLEKQMKEFCQELPSERNVASKFAIGDDEYFSDDSDDEDYLEGSYFIPETGATITKQNAVPLIHRYCSSLPSDSFCVLKPIYEITTTGEGFKCLLHLPSNAALTEFESQVTRSKDHAKALVSLQACKELRRVGVLDNHLIPFNYKQELLGEMSAQHDENGLVIGSKRRHGMYEKRTPKLWDRPREMEDLEEEIGVEVDEDLLRAVAHKQDDETDEEPSLNHATELLKQITRFTPLEELKAKEKEVQEKEEKEKKEKEQGSIAEAAGENATEEPKVELTELEKLNMVSLDDEEAKEVEKEEEEELGEGPFAHWMTVLEVMMKDNEFNGLPYRRICIMSKKPVPEIPQLKLFYKSEPFHVNVRPLSVEFSFDRERTLHLSDYMSKLMKSLLNKDFHCPVVDVPYYILPLVSGCENVRYEDLSVEEVEELIDWEEISNIVEFKSEPFVLDGNSKPKDKIVLDYTSNRRQFMIEDIRYDMNPNSPVPKETPCRESEYSCFQAYYEEKQKMVPTDLNQPMIYARQIRKTLNFLYPGEIGIGKIKGNLHSWVVPEFCYTYYMSASVFLGMLMVPSIMTRIDSFLLIKEAQVRYDLHMEDNSMLEAYTCPGASMEMNYERLETLGGKCLFVNSLIYSNICNNKKNHSIRFLAKVPCDNPSVYQLSLL
jgi:hypothetical protein